MEHFEALFTAILNGIDEKESEFGSSHPLYLVETVFVVPMAPKVVTEYLNNRNQFFVATFPTAAFASSLSSPVYSNASPLLSIPSFKKSFFQRLQCLFQSFMVNFAFGRVIAYPIPMMDLRHLYAKPTLKLISSLPSLSTLVS